EASVADHLDIVEVRKHEFASRVGNREAALVPEFHQPLLCVSAHSGVSLRPTELDTGVDKLTSQTRASEFPADSQALSFCKIGKVTKAQTTGRFVSHITDQVGCSEIVPIEFFLVRALLFANKDRPAHHRRAHDIVERPCNPDRSAGLERVRARYRTNGCLLMARQGAAEQEELGCRPAATLRGTPTPHT